MICKLFRRLENTQRIFVLSLFNLHLCLVRFDLLSKSQHVVKLIEIRRTVEFISLYSSI